MKPVNAIKSIVGRTCHPERSAVRRVVEGSVLALLLTACGDDSSSSGTTPENTSSIDEVADVSLLPPCTASNEYTIIRVLNEETPRICRNSKWFAIAEESAAQSPDSKDDKISSSVAEPEKGKGGKSSSSNSNNVTKVNSSDSKKVESSNSDKKGWSSSKDDSNIIDIIEPRDSIVLDSEKVAIDLNEVSGVTQKGPFLSGSKVLVHELSDGHLLLQTGNSFNGKIANDNGEFKIRARMLVCQYISLEASGYYRNEVTGENSNSELTMFAITDASVRNSVNVNLITHLEYERVLYLVTQKKMKFKDAKKQAQKEIFGLLNIDATKFSNSEDLNIAGGSDEDAALLAFSIILQGDRSVSQLSELLTKIAIDMEKDGSWDNAAKRMELADWAAENGQKGRLSTIRNNVTAWKLSSVVPNFEKHIHHFWTMEYGLETCSSDNQGAVFQNTNEQSKLKGEYFICDNEKWRPASAIEQDTYGWNSGNDGDDKSGSINANNCYVYEDNAWRAGNTSDCLLSLHGCTALRQDTVGLGSDSVWHICDNKNWRDATTYEKDTFGWKDSTDGAIKKGDVTDSVYVFDKTAWRATSAVEGTLGGCVAAIADSVGKVGSAYYICKSNRWVEASAAEYDTYRWSAGKDGDAKSGSVNVSNCYVFEDKVWRSGNSNDCSLGLRGCTTLRQDTVGLGSDKIWHICDNKSWRNATDIEKDTATWGAGTFEGEVRAGQVNKTIYYIYETSNKSWRNATTLEKDTYDYTNNMDWLAGTDGEIKKGSVTDSVYVYDATTWRTADDAEKKLGGCVTAIADSIGKVGSTYYICTQREWIPATVLQYDTYKKECLTDGSIVDGNIILSNKYVCDDGVFRAATEYDIRAGLGCTNYTEGEFKILSGQYSYYKCESSVWNLTTEKLNQGTMTDERDGNEYKTIGIGSQLWMAENLNYADEEKFPSMIERNWCYKNVSDNCIKYGRLYTWSAAIDSVTLKRNKNMDCGSTNRQTCKLSEPVQGICPTGWHVPTEAEWYMLFNTVGGEKIAGKMLKSKNDWSGGENSFDNYGFSAIPGGNCQYQCIEADFLNIDNEAHFWTSNMWDSWYAISILMYYDHDLVEKNTTIKTNGNSIRCVKD